MKSLTLSVLPGRFCVCRCDANHPLPVEFLKGSFFSVTRTADELSLVLPETEGASFERCQGGWRCFKVLGPLDFSLVGVLAALSQPLAQAGISIFAVSTYDTDYLFVQESSLEQAMVTLESAGFKVERKC